MSLAGISTSSFYQPGATQSFFSQRASDLKQLGQALRAGISPTHSRPTAL